jgi:hypothetical protein
VLLGAVRQQGSCWTVDCRVGPAPQPASRLLSYPAPTDTNRTNQFVEHIAPTMCPTVPICCSGPRRRQDAQLVNTDEHAQLWITLIWILEALVGWHGLDTGNGWSS